MPIYKYSAMSATGQKIEEQKRANTKSEILSMLRENRYYPISIEEVLENNRGNEITLFQFSKVKIKDIAVFCRQLYTMLNAGVTLINSLDILKQQTENKRFKKIIGEIHEDVQKGMTFSEVLRNYQNIFPDILIHMVETGEATGSLDRIMERMAIYFEKEYKINSKVKAAMVYPMVLSIVSVFVVIFLLTFVMPTFVGMFESSGVELPGPTRFLLGVSGALKTYWYIFLSMGLVIIFSMKKYSKTNQFVLVLDTWKLKIPILKGTTQMIITSRFTRTLSILMYSGIPLMQALDIVSKVVGNKVAEQKILEAKEEVRRGMDLASPIKKSGIFPPMVDSMIRIGEESGSMDDILDKTANFFDEEVESAMQKLTAMIEPLMIVVMAFVIGFIVIAMVLPMFDMMNTVGM